MKKKSLTRFLSSFLLLSMMMPLFTGNIPVKNVSAASFKQAGIANVEYKFTDTDDNDVYTTSASGQTTVIIFGKTDCGNSRGTVKSVASGNWVGNPDIRVIFAEISNASLEETKSFAGAYGCSAITFCYDVGFKISRAWNDYCDMSDGNIASLPTTVLIDGSNQVQKVLSGYQSANAIMNEINRFNSGDYEEESPKPDETNPKLNVSIEGTESYAYANDVLDLVNQTRAKGGLSELKPDSELTEAAMQRAAEIALYYSHTRPDGTQCFTVSKRGTKKAENIAAGYPAPNNAMNAWIGSPGHYANIMDADMESIGIGCFQDSEGVWYWVQFFDNAAANAPNVSGDKKVTRTVSMQKAFFHLQSNGSLTFDETDINKAIQMVIRNANEEYTVSKPKLLPSGFNFKSSNDTVATVSGDGIITPKSAGTATITASHKESASLFIEQTVTVKGANSIVVTPPSVVTPPPVLSASPTVQPDVSGSPSGNPATPPVSGSPSGNPVTPPVSGSPSGNPATPPVSGSPSGNPATPPVSGSPSGNPATPPVSGNPSGNPATPPVSDNEDLKVPNVSNLRSNSGETTIKLSWKKVADATGYLLYQYDGSNKKWNRIAKVNSGNVSYTVRKLKSGTAYRFAVKAYLDKNDRRVTSADYASLYTATNPETVKFTVKAGKKKVSLKWKKAGGATGYTVYYKTGQKDTLKKLVNTKGNSYTVGSLMSGKKYYFAVKAYKTYKGKTYNGSYTTKSVKVK